MILLESNQTQQIATGIQGCQPHGARARALIDNPGDDLPKGEFALPVVAQSGGPSDEERMKGRAQGAYGISPFKRTKILPPVPAALAGTVACTWLRSGFPGSGMIVKATPPTVPVDSGTVIVWLVHGSLVPRSLLYCNCNTAAPRLVPLRHRKTIARLPLLTVAGGNKAVAF